MAGLSYVGRNPDADRHVMRRLSAFELLDTGTTRAYALDRITTLAAPLATKSYVDLADASFTSPGYVDTQDALNLPLSARGVPNGVATLDSSGRLPIEQAPNLGIGMVKGPYGASSLISADTATSLTPVQLATIDIAAPGFPFKPLAFAGAFVGQARLARALLEWRIGAPIQTTYASQSRLGVGFGRQSLDDFQMITCRLSGAAPGITATPGYDGSMAWRLTLWLYSDNPNTVTVRNGNIVTCCAHVMRTAL